MIPGGQYVDGFLVIDNTGPAFTISEGTNNTIKCGPQLQGLLYGNGIAQQAGGWPLDCSAPLPVTTGITRIPVSFSTFYEGPCTSTTYPPCAPGETAPPLGPGLYYTVVLWDQPSPLPPPPTVTVTVLPQLAGPPDYPSYP